MLKSFVAPDFRRQLKASNLDAYTSLVLWFNVTLQVARIHIIGLNKYKYYFDRTDRYGTSIRHILHALRDENNMGLKVWAVHGEPIEVDSRAHRFVQLSDAIGYFLARYRQFEVRTFRPSPTLLKYEDKVREIHRIIEPKVLSFVKDGLGRLWIGRLCRNGHRRECHGKRGVRNANEGTPLNSLGGRPTARSWDRISGDRKHPARQWPGAMPFLARFICEGAEFGASGW